MILTEQQEKERVAALTQELHAYEVQGKPERAKEVKAELDRLGAASEPPQKRAAKRAKGKKKTEL